MEKIYLYTFIILGFLGCQNNTKKTKPFIKGISYVKGESFLSKNNDSAFYYFTKVTSNPQDSLEVAMAYYHMSVIQSDEGDYFGAQESLTLSLTFLKDSNPRHFSCIASDYNELGVTNVSLKKYNSAINYYDLALKYSKNESNKLIFLNNKAVAYQNAGKYSEAINLFETILLKYADRKKEYARTLSNLTKSKWLSDTTYSAASRFLYALHIRITENDKWGQNASYAHLSDYYNKRNPDSALFFANKMYATAINLNSPDDQLEALTKLIRLSPAKSQQYFERYYNLSDSLQTARNAAKNQFAVVRYETEKHKADNLVLQKENNEKKYQIIIISSLMLFILAGGIFWYRRRKKDIEAQSQKAIRENKLKTSQKVHDVVANGLYRIMSKLDNQVTLKDNPIINEIEELYEQSRDLSYEKPKSKNQDFHDKIFELLKSFASENTRVILVGNSATLWEKVSEQAKDEIEHILQELMVNMGKHSQASDVVIKFEQVQQKINIFYTDNGIGIAGKPQPQNGLTNTGTRIDAIGGTIIFDTKVEKGLKIQISFPVS